MSTLLDYKCPCCGAEQQTVSYDHFVECYGDLHANYTSFRNACKGVMNGKSTGFYWNPHK